MSKSLAAFLLIAIVLCFVAAFSLIKSTLWLRYEKHEKTTHANNLKQIGIGLESYHKDYGSFPFGTIPNHDLSPSQRLSWIVSILPFVEQDNVYQSIDQSKECRAMENSSEVYQGEFIFSSGYECVNTRCVGMAGIGIDAAELQISNPRVGVFGYDRKTRLADISDGAAYTMMVIGTNKDIGPWAAGGSSTVRGIDTQDKPFIGPNRQFGGLFRGGTYILMADGSVRWIKESIDSSTFEALATIAGGEKVELPADY